MSNNRLTLTGTVTEVPVFSHEVFGEGFFETKLAVSRLSEQIDILPITISDRLIIEHDIKVGDKVTVQGQFRSYNKVVDEKSRLMLTVFVREIMEDSECDSMNDIEITGYICKEPIYRTTPFKREICDVLLAVNRAYNKSDYIPCITWGRNARFIKNLPIGTKISVRGRVQSRVYQKTDDEGNITDRTAYEVSVSKIATEQSNYLQRTEENVVG